ncbi:glycosyltransferase [Paenalcaligenes niemegkensis]|uniref:glycosyltransferase n=1 Tax=Paenalcaligenes niemegkensis TaxID=2895469 RepID=UPI001EE7C7C0|nr:glycosyltransferase [Paenalcaligenes niemegkensis]MCQ9618255.1 glycosyltransferase [Paenalcaligenes niemegkensis]
MFVAPVYRPSFYNGGKGGEISNQILLEGVARLDHTVVVISMMSLVRKRVYRDGGLIVIEPFSQMGGKGIGGFLSMLFFKYALSNLLDRVLPNVILATTSTIRVASEVSRNAGLPVGAIVRAMENLPGYGWEWSVLSPKSLAKYLAHKVTIGWPGIHEIKAVDFFIANSDFLRRKYLHEFPEKNSLVVYPALSIHHANRDFPTKIKKVMMVGVSREKGFDVFLKLASDFPELEFHALGAPSLLPGEVRTYKGVYIHGWLPDPIPFIDSVDLVVVPSSWEEPFGRISVEALYRRKFVLVSGRGGLPETVSNVSELVIYSNSADHWRERIEKLMQMPEEYERCLLKALDGAEQFSLPTQSISFEKFLMEIDSNKNSD